MRRCADVLLPREVGPRGIGDRLTELVIVDGGDEPFQNGIEDGRRRYGAHLAALRRTGRRFDRADTEAQLGDVEALVAQARDELFAQERELACPHARRGPYGENAALEQHRLGPVGDTHSDRFDPGALPDGHTEVREPVLAVTREDLIEPLWREQRPAAAGAGHEREPKT